ncbi:hypothetical protein [Streptomyces paradoxus]
MATDPSDCDKAMPVASRLVAFVRAKVRFPHGRFAGRPEAVAA